MPAKSKQQFKAMAAAASGHSTLRIPAKVGRDFINATRGYKNLPKRTKKRKKVPSTKDMYES